MRTKSERKVRKRKLIVVGGILAAAVVLASAVLVGSGAAFTATSANPSNVFTAGTLTMSNDVTGAILSMSDMKPGSSVSGDVTIKNTGSLGGTFSLTAGETTHSEPAGKSALKNALWLTITDDDSEEVYDGYLKDFTAPEDLGVFASGDETEYHFVVSFLPTGTDAGDNLFQGSSSTYLFTWNAVQ